MPNYTNSTANIRRRFLLNPPGPRPKRPASRLLALPAELREAIYAFALSDLLASPKDDGDTAFTTDSSTYRALRRVNRQVSDDVRSVFATRFASTLEIHTRSWAQVAALRRAARSTVPELRGAVYWLTYDVEDEGWRILAMMYARVLGRAWAFALQRGGVMAMRGEVGS